MSQNNRIQHQGLKRKVCSAEEAAQFIHAGDLIGTSGFTGSGYPKAVPQALANRIKEAHALGKEFKVKLITGASTGT